MAEACSEACIWYTSNRNSRAAQPPLLRSRAWPGYGELGGKLLELLGLGWLGWGRLGRRSLLVRGARRVGPGHGIYCYVGDRPAVAGQLVGNVEHDPQRPGRKLPDEPQPPFVVEARGGRKLRLK